MSTDRDSTITLAAAAQALGMSYERAKRLVLIGQLAGQQESGRWWRVTSESVEQFKNQRSEQAAIA